MKKIRMFLTAGVVLALVSGALAFKAKSLTSTWCIDNNSNCVFSGYQTALIPGAATSVSPCAAFANTNVFTASCPGTGVAPSGTYYATTHSE